MVPESEGGGEPWYRVDRRTLLASGTALAGGIAGCPGLTDQRYEAAPVRLSAEAADLGYAFDDAETKEVSESREVEGNEISVTIVSYSAQYTYDGEGGAGPRFTIDFGLAATPKAEQAGQTLNPVADASVEELTGGEVGRKYLDEDSEFAGREWSSGPERVATESATMLGTETTVETYVGIDDDEEYVVVSAAKVEDDGDAVFAGGSHSPDVAVPAPPEIIIGEGGVPEPVVEEQTALVAETLPTVVRETATELDGEIQGGDGDDVIDPADVPVEFHRRAAKHVVEAGGTETTRGEWADATLDGHVRPLYRPDVEGVAYYEFGVEPEGFVVVATGEHDFPIPHWNYVRDPPSVELAEEAEGQVDRFYRLDSLYNVAEVDGEMAAEWGTRLTKIEGADRSMLGTEERAVREYGPVDPDADPEDLEYELKTSEGPDEVRWEYGEFEDWSEMKEDFADSFDLHLEALRQEAREEWAFLEELADRGIGLLPEETRRIPLLSPEADYRLSGPGAEFVEIDDVEDALRLTVEGSGEERLPFSLEIEYEDGRSESINYALPGPETLSAVEILESGAAGSLPGQPVAATGGLEGALATGGWDYSWAGTAADQREYQQFQHNGCAVGCGPVAWAMMFGWADVQADDGSSKWSRQRWLFREDGGKHPKSDIRAPNRARNDNAAMNVIEELNSTLGTFCLFGGGATPPWKMADAWKFGRNRARIWCLIWGTDTMVTKKWIRNKARDIIKQTNTPAIIGTGMPKHYPIAYGYAVKTERKGYGLWRRTVYHRWFYLNQGHGNARSGWVNGTFWAAGLAHPYSVNI
jgi:hypothetical protein